ncbi:virulence protein RhuM/Fic/DOC family protein [bacterium]|nr:virulence protein RhuM/Fic/DOC family protein [bacterium]
MESGIIIYTTQDGTAAIDVTLENETVWLTQKQMAELFDRDQSVLSRHIRNVFKEKELDEKSNMQKMHIANSDKPVTFYNLDVIISVGYRVKSRRGTQFRIWATSVLKEYLIKGYALNEKRLKDEATKLFDLQKTISLLENTIAHQKIEFDQTKELVKVVADFSYGLSILDGYDHQSIEISDTTKGESYFLTYEEAREIVDEMIKEFDTGLFGREKDESFKGALGNIYQTFGGDELYPSIEEKASHLLYFIVKDHAFLDGNKRIAAAVFLYFLSRNKLLYTPDGSKRIADNALAAITLMIAESKPAEKDIIVKVVVNLINRKN